ncbi:hypothetical protein B0J15DRAFT_477197 [Fusarium solani]|uniref:NmrA-like domain-containing protein n=2 Tax=Fusarium solani TaxID=169388 RepID=A0A9P9L3H0_FUSSL|nr:uncharacterized protein B0J15DRAFT_477197 [Fusarium solani]KAH7273466.1 hypothetical protein B0J15DRAFT_477197 [Fusarium solani]
MLMSLAQWDVEGAQRVGGCRSHEVALHVPLNSIKPPQVHGTVSYTTISNQKTKKDLVSFILPTNNMAQIARNVALLGATGTLGSHILTALKGAGFSVTAIQRKDSTKAVPQGIKSVKVDLANKDDLVSAFRGQDAVVSAVPNPALLTEKIMIDAAIEASVKRIIPSEYSTNLESPLSRKLPIVTEKAKIREYLTSVISSTDSPTTWTSINNGPFFEMCLRFGVLGPNLREKKATFHNGGNNMIGTSTLPDIATAVAKVLDSAHFAETANQPVYIYSAAVSERLLTELASKVTGIDFGTVEDGRIADLDVDELVRDSDEKRSKGDMSGMFNYYYQMMYGKGYGGTDFKELSWNDRLGLKSMTEEDIEGELRTAAVEFGLI